MTSSYPTRLASPEDIPAVLALQEKYLVTNLSPEARKQGFVTTPFTIPQLNSIIAQDGLFVATSHGQIVAYVFAGSWEYFSQWPIFVAMIARFPSLTVGAFPVTTSNSFQYGPICIHEDFRGSGLIHDIFECMRLNMREKYPISLTFINKINTRSMRAHVDKLGWKIVDEFEFNQNAYAVLGFEMG